MKTISTVAERFVGYLERERIFDDPIVTEIRPLGTFFEAEEYHRDYFGKHPDEAYCRSVIAP